MRRTSKLEGYSTALIGTAASGAAFVLSGSFFIPLLASVALVSLTASIALGLYTMGIHWNDQRLDALQYDLFSDQFCFADNRINDAVRQRNAALQNIKTPYQSHTANG